MSERGFVTYLVLGLLVIFIALVFASTAVSGYLASAAKGNTGYLADAKAFAQLQNWEALRGLPLLDVRLAQRYSVSRTSQTSLDAGSASAVNELCANPRDYSAYTFLTFPSTPPSPSNAPCPFTLPHQAFNQVSGGGTSLVSPARMGLQKRVHERGLVTLVTNLNLGGGPTPVTEWASTRLRLIEYIDERGGWPARIVWLNLPSLSQGSLVDSPTMVRCSFASPYLDVGVMREDRGVGSDPGAMFLEGFACLYDTNLATFVSRSSLGTSPTFPQVRSRLHPTSGPSSLVSAPEFYLPERSRPSLPPLPFEPRGGFSLAGLGAQAGGITPAALSAYYNNLNATYNVSLFGEATVILEVLAGRQRLQVVNSSGTAVLTLDYSAPAANPLVVQVNASTVRVVRRGTYALLGGGSPHALVLRTYGTIVIEDHITAQTSSCTSPPRWTGSGPLPALCPNAQSQLLYLVAPEIRLAEPRSSWVLNGVVLVPYGQPMRYDRTSSVRAVDLYLVGAWFGMPWRSTATPIPRLFATTPRLTSSSLLLTPPSPSGLRTFIASDPAE